MLQIADFGSGRVTAAIIDINDLIIDAAVERGGNLGDERRDIAGFVLDRDDDRKFHAVFYAVPRAAARSFSPKQAAETDLARFVLADKSRSRRSELGTLAGASQYRMTDQEVDELAAILVHEHGNAAREVAEERRSLHESGSDGFRLWTRIAAAVGRMLRLDQPANAHQHSR